MSQAIDVKKITTVSVRRTHLELAKLNKDACVHKL